MPWNTNLLIDQSINQSINQSITPSSIYTSPFFTLINCTKLDISVTWISSNFLFTRYLFTGQFSHLTFLTLSPHVRSLDTFLTWQESTSTCLLFKVSIHVLILLLLFERPGMMQTKPWFYARWTTSKRASYVCMKKWNCELNMSSTTYVGCTVWLQLVIL